MNFNEKTSSNSNHNLNSRNNSNLNHINNKTLEHDAINLVSSENECSNCSISFESLSNSNTCDYKPLFKVDNNNNFPYRNYNNNYNFNSNYVHNINNLSKNVYSKPTIKKSSSFITNQNMKENENSQIKFSCNQNEERRKKYNEFINSNPINIYKTTSNSSESIIEKENGSYNDSKINKNNISNNFPFINNNLKNDIILDPHFHVENNISKLKNNNNITIHDHDYKKKSCENFSSNQLNSLDRINENRINKSNNYFIDNFKNNQLNSNDDLTEEDNYNVNDEDYNLTDYYDDLSDEESLEKKIKENKEIDEKIKKREVSVYYEVILPNVLIEKRIKLDKLTSRIIDFYDIYINLVNSNLYFENANFKKFYDILFDKRKLIMSVDKYIGTTTFLSRIAYEFNEYFHNKFSKNELTLYDSDDTEINVSLSTKYTNENQFTNIIYLNCKENENLDLEKKLLTEFKIKFGHLIFEFNIDSNDLSSIIPLINIRCRNMLIIFDEFIKNEMTIKLIKNLNCYIIVTTSDLNSVDFFFNEPNKRYYHLINTQDSEDFHLGISNENIIKIVEDLVYDDNKNPIFVKNRDFRNEILELLLKDFCKKYKSNTIYSPLLIYQSLFSIFDHSKFIENKLSYSLNLFSPEKLAVYFNSMYDKVNRFNYIRILLRKFEEENYMKFIPDELDILELELKKERNYFENYNNIDLDLNENKEEKKCFKPNNYKNASIINENINSLNSIIKPIQNSQNSQNNLNNNNFKNSFISNSEINDKSLNRTNNCKTSEFNFDLLYNFLSSNNKIYNDIKKSVLCLVIPIEDEFIRSLYSNGILGIRFNKRNFKYSVIIPCLYSYNYLKDILKRYIEREKCKLDNYYKINDILNRLTTNENVKENNGSASYNENNKIFEVEFSKLIRNYNRYKLNKMDNLKINELSFSKDIDSLLENYLDKTQFVYSREFKIYWGSNKYLDFVIKDVINNVTIILELKFDRKDKKNNDKYNNDNTDKLYKNKINAEYYKQIYMYKIAIESNYQPSEYGRIIGILCKKRGECNVQTKIIDFN